MDTNKSNLKLILVMGIPPILSMLIQSLYSIVDGIFVGQISDAAFNAISIAYPITNLTLALSVGLGVGINSLMARSLGAGNEKKARKAASTYLFCSIFHYLLFVILGLIIIPFFFNCFTKNEEIIRLGKEYLAILLFLCLGQQIHIAIEKIFQAHGKMAVGMIAQCLGCAVNIALDALFIYVFKMGVAGAAIATVIGQFSSCIYIFIIGLRDKYISLNFKELIPEKKILKEIYQVAIPSTIMSALVSFLTLVLNLLLKRYGDDYVQILGVYFKLQTFIYMPLNGMIQGLRPIFGYFYGKGENDRLKDSIKKSIYLMLIFTILGLILFMLIPSILMRPFTKNELVIKEGITALRIISIGFIPSGFSLIIVSLYESIGSGIRSLIISLLRGFIIPVLYSLVCVYALKMSEYSIYLSIAIGEIATLFVAGIIYFTSRKIIFIEKESSLN